MKTLLVGIGAAGNKAAVQAVANGIVSENDVIIINSTSKDFPKEFDGKTIVLSPHDTGCGKERSSMHYLRSRQESSTLILSMIMYQ